jgi:hypothetical protein
MASKQNRSDASRSVRGGASDALGRVLFRLSTQLFGGRMSPPDGPDWRLGGEQPPAKPTHPAAEAARILERALNEAETMLGKLERGLRSAPAQEHKDEAMASQEFSELQQYLRALTGRLEEALARLAHEIERLAAGTVHLTQLVDRLEAQPVAPAAPAPEAEEAAPPAEPVAVPATQEPRFEPGEQALGVVIAAVPGFQGLMDVQRGLSGLPAVAGAPVRRYKNGEALLEVALREPVSVSQIVQKLETTTGRSMLIEEAHPESLRLRLRFVDGEGRALDGQADPETANSLRRDD